MGLGPVGVFGARVCGCTTRGLGRGRCSAVVAPWAGKPRAQRRRLWLNTGENLELEDLVGLADWGNLSEGFRTNMGIQNLWAERVLEVVFRDAKGRELGRRQVRLRALEGLRSFRPLSAFRPQGVELASAVVRLVGAKPRFHLRLTGGQPRGRRQHHPRLQAALVRHSALRRGLLPGGRISRPVYSGARNVSFQPGAPSSITSPEAKRLSTIRCPLTNTPLLEPKSRMV